ncbi:MAG: ferric reductase-like transmembrane domain-containing protein [Candidatus Aminicenantaceae bacterium]
MSVAARKRILIAGIIVTSAAPLLFVRWNEPTPALQTFKMLAKTGALCGTLLAVWQLLLGFRRLAGRVLTDLIWVLSSHKTIGRWVLYLIALHPVFITVYYLIKKGYNPLFLEGGLPFAGYVAAGMAALLLFLAVVITSVYFRAKMPWQTWFGIHITSYLAVSLVFVHSLPIGMTVGETGLRPVWWALSGVVAAILLFRAAFRLGAFTFRHKVSEVKNVAPDVVKISMQPAGRRVGPKPGQFVYIRRGPRGSARPFTASHYDESTGELAVTIKAIGPTTRRFQKMKPGDAVYADGPYGIFGREALRSAKPIVMIAGGIGITPFPRLIRAFKETPRDEIVLFFGNKKTEEIIFGNELERIEGLRIVHVISHDPDYTGETGFITPGIMNRHLEKPLPEHEFLICGPPIMTQKLEAALRREGVPDAQIHHELFSY